MYVVPSFIFAIILYPAESVFTNYFRIFARFAHNWATGYGFMARYFFPETKITSGFTYVCTYISPSHSLSPPCPLSAPQTSLRRNSLTRTPTTSGWARGPRWTWTPWGALTAAWWSSSACARSRTPRAARRPTRSSRPWRSTRPARSSFWISDARTGGAGWGLLVSPRLVGSPHQIFVVYYFLPFPLHFLSHLAHV